MSTSPATPDPLPGNDQESTSGPPDGKKRKRQKIFAAAALLLGLSTGLLFLEIATRVILIRHSESVDQLFEEYARKDGELFTLRDLIRPSANPARIYELQPGASGIFVDVPVRINSAGFRDVERKPEKAAGTRRIAVLGDSIAFGWGVPAQDRFSSRLEDLLNEAATSATLQQESKMADSSGEPERWEVLNFAVPGYNSVMELATLREAVLNYAPDVLVVSVVANDAELPNFIRDKADVLAFNRLFIYEAVRDQLRGVELLQTARQAAGGLMITPEFRPDQVPSRYRFLVGYENARKALSEMAAIAWERRIPAVAVFHYPRLNGLMNRETSAALSTRTYNTPWIDACRSAGFTIVDPLPELLGFARSRALHEQSLWVKPEEDMHPNAEGHGILARHLAGQLVPLVRNGQRSNAP